MNTKVNRVLWIASSVAAVVLVVGLIAVGARRPSGGSDGEADERAVRATVTAFTRALADGDLPALRELTCAQYIGGFFAKTSPDQYKRVHDSVLAAGDVLTVDNVDAVTVTPPTAQAHVTTHTNADPKPERYSYSLRQEGGKWKICEPGKPQGN